MSTDYRALCAELAQALAEEYGVRREFDAGDPLLGSGVIELLSRARTALAQPEPEEVGGAAGPSGYAYCYPTMNGKVVRFNHGQEVNGSRPLYAIPYWLGQPPTARPAIEPVSEVLTDEAIEELTWRHTCEIGDLGVGIAVEDAPAFIRAVFA